MLTDTHCHLQFNGYNNDRGEVINRCLTKDMFLNIVGTQKDTSKKAIELAKNNENFYASIGLHPVHLYPTQIDEEESSFLSREEDFDYDYYKELASDKKVIGIGECGLDFFHLPKNLEFSKILEKQKQEFLKQVNLACELDLALVVHVRNSDDVSLPNAYDEIIKILTDVKKEKPNLRGVIHCYGGSWGQAEKILSLGFYIGFTGILTFPARKTNLKSTENLIETVIKIPLDSFLIETDSPYLAPQKYRGQRCEPFMVEEVAKKIAELRGISYEEIKEQAWQNAKKVFKI